MRIMRLLTLTLALFLSLASAAQARIDILPRKVVVEGRDRSGEITVMNMVSEKPSTFRLELEAFRQDESGTYHVLEGPLNPAFDHDKVVRLSPRQFTLPPGGRQKIRFSIRTPANLPSGEYRFHLKATEMPDPTETPENPDLKGPRVHMKMNMGVSIPVIFRNGNLTATAKISNVTLVSADRSQKGAPELRMKIDRKGTASAVGILTVYWAPQGGEKHVIGNIVNMNIFPEVTYRNAVVPLTEMPAGPGTITVLYENDAGAEKGQSFDEVTLQR